MTRVAHLPDGVSVGESTEAPWSLALDTAAYPRGPATVTFIARDAAGNAGASPGVQLVLDDAGPAGAGGCSAAGGPPLLLLPLGLSRRRRR
ncbi:MAG: hypothetical protein AMXMBFR34_05290 [Myxococcaceae bacterium]